LWYVPDTNGKGGPIERLSWGLTPPIRTTPPTPCVWTRAAQSISATASFSALTSKRPRAGAKQRRPSTGLSRARENLNLRFLRFRKSAWARLRLLGQRPHHRRHGERQLFWSGVQRSHRLPGKHEEMAQFWDRPSRPCAGTGLISSRTFRRSFRATSQLQRHRFPGDLSGEDDRSGSGEKGELQEAWSVPPTQLSSGGRQYRPDGAIYFCDWHKPLIGHMQHHLRDPNREQDHGAFTELHTKTGRS